MLDIKPAKILSRPSKICKSPYVADILLEGQTYQAHAPALGCCGLSEKDGYVFVSPIKDGKTCKYTIQLAIFVEKEKNNYQIIGINPKLAEKIVKNTLAENLIPNLDVETFKPEVTIEDSRFDFVGTTKSGEKFALEVKNVPLADYVDCEAKMRKKMDFSEREGGSKISYFPDGYRKKANDPVSPRALKHINTLAKLSSSMKTYMCYVVQRTDSCSFQPSVVDQHYRKAFYEARELGVQMIVLVVQWSKDGTYKLVNTNLPIND